LSGFFSKDEILAAAATGPRHNLFIFIIAAFVALLTSFYMFRLWFVAFGGKARSESAEHAHESPSVMLWPLRILAILSIVGGVIGINAYLGRFFAPAGQAEEHATSFVQEIFAPFGHAPLAALAGLAAFAFGLSFAYRLYAKATNDPFPVKARMVSRILRNAFYFDTIYAFLISITHETTALIADWLDRWLIAGAGVRGLHGSVEILGRALRLVQNGSLQTYAFLFAIGVAVVLFLALR